METKEVLLELGKKHNHFQKNGGKMLCIPTGNFTLGMRENNTKPAIRKRFFSQFNISIHNLEMLEVSRNIG